MRDLCASKDIIKKVKRHPTKWEKILASHLSDEGLIFRIYKKLQKKILNNKRTNNQTQKWANRHFSKEDVCSQ